MNSAAKNDEDFVDRLQERSFRYFLELWNPENGLIPDTNEPGAPASIAGVGFALGCYAVSVERGFLTRREAARRTKITLEFFSRSEQGHGPTATGYKGFYYHFLEMKSGKRTWSCELSLIDTGLLLAGIVCVGEYFSGTDPQESEIRRLAGEIVNRVDWNWAANGNTSLSQGWKPESGFMEYDWEGYSEALILYALALGSDTHPLPPESFQAWTSTYQWENIYDFDLLYSGPLFIHFFSHAWIDFREIQDDFMREKKTDYFENTRNAIAVQRAYCYRNPKEFRGYGHDCWGLTAAAGPGLGLQEIDGVKRTFLGYAARGVPFGPDDGTIAPWVSLAALPFSPVAAREAVNHFRTTYPQTLGEYGFKCSFNASCSPAWYPNRFYALDTGLSVLMIENARSGLIWELMKNSGVIQRGLARAGFKGGWLKNASGK